MKSLPFSFSDCSPNDLLTPVLLSLLLFKSSQEAHQKMHGIRFGSYTVTVQFAKVSLKVL